LYEERPPYSDVVKEIIKLDHGWLQIPEVPGIGVELDEEGIAKHPYEYGPISHALRDDGSIALR